MLRRRAADPAVKFLAQNNTLTQQSQIGQRTIGCWQKV
ncbi:hypothetical protein [Deinococcus sp. QL22]|nr:hypothetical protein [Deinococcus sp. QL22]UQN08536.1 hypothetical protein M1R55_17185 [Deinococcus sp. QL22]